MGHASGIALGIAQVKKNRHLFCLDGDGAMMMHMGAIPQIKIVNIGPTNYKHILFNNQAHDSVGAQPTSNPSVNFTYIVLGCNYKDAFQVQTKEDITKGMERFNQNDDPIIIEILIKPGVRKDLGRPTITTFENKEKFLHFLTY